MAVYKVPANVEIPTCQECGAEWIDERTAKILDEALEKVYETRLRERLDLALEKILGEQEVSQARVERVLGLSPGYLSKLKGERRNPSPALVAALAGLLPDPGQRINQIEKFMHGGRAAADGGRKRASH